MRTFDVIEKRTSSLDGGKEIENRLNEGTREYLLRYYTGEI